MCVLCYTYSLICVCYVIHTVCYVMCYVIHVCYVIHMCVMLLCVLSAVLAGVRRLGTLLDMNTIIAFSFIKYTDISISGNRNQQKLTFHR